MASTIPCSNESHGLKMSCAGKNFLQFFSKIFLPFFVWGLQLLIQWEGMKNHSLFGFSMRKLFCTFRHRHCISVSFFVFFYISGEPKLYIDFKQCEQWLITFPGMFSVPSLTISKILCTFWLIPTEPWANVFIVLFKASPKSLSWMLIANLQFITV